MHDRLPERPKADPEVAEEQAYVTRAYARLEAMRAAAERRGSGTTGAGGTRTDTAA